MEYSGARVELVGRVAIVTGAAAGIGRATAVALVLPAAAVAATRVGARARRSLARDI